MLRNIKAATATVFLRGSLLAFALIAAQPCFSSPAASSAPGENVTAVANTISITKSFAELGAGRDPVRLGTWKAAYVLKLPYSPREELKSAKIFLSIANSTALIKSRSQLAVRVNDQIIAQYTLDPVNSINTRTIVLPIELLKSGYNDVTFEVVQHYTYECEDPYSPDLWTEINPIESNVTMQFAGLRPNLEPKLTQLHVAFDARGWIPRPLAVVSGTEHVSEVQAAAAALVVQGIALNMGYRPLDIQVYGASTGASIAPERTKFPGLSSAVVKGRDVLLIGKRAELSRYLDTDLYKATAVGPFVGIFPGMQGDSVILVVSGDTDEELMTAARSLAQPDFKFSDVSMEHIKDKWAFKHPAEATPEVPVPFSTFDYRTQTSRGMQAAPAILEFRAPADYGARKGDLGSVRLHFSYGAGLREDSSMIVKLNGQFTVAVPLSQKEGAEFQRYEIKVPAEYVKPGYNTLTFQPVFLVHKGTCDMVRDDGLVLTVYEDSTLEIPGASVLPVAPDLARFAQGFWPLQDEFRLYLTADDTQTVAAALSFVASVAQKNRAPFEISLRYSPFTQGNMMVIGPTQGVAPFIEKALPLQRYSWGAEGTHVGLLQAVEGKRVVTAFLAEDAPTLKSAVAVLDSKGLWAGMSGQAAIVDTLEQTLVTEPATTTTAFGSMSKLSISLGSWKRMAPIAALLALIFAVLFVSLLRQHAARRRELSSPNKK